METRSLFLRAKSVEKNMLNVWRIDRDLPAHVTEEKTSEKDMDVPTKVKETKTVPGNTNLRCLRSRNNGAEPRGNNVDF